MAIAFFALMAGFGFFTYGDALADFFVAMGHNHEGNTIIDAGLWHEPVDQLAFSC